MVFRPLEKERKTQEQCPSQDLDGHNHLPATQVLKSQGRAKPAAFQVVGHGNNMTYHVHVYFFTVSHEHVLKPSREAMGVKLIEPVSQAGGAGVQSPLVADQVWSPYPSLIPRLQVAILPPSQKKGPCGEALHPG